jgi:hypothetical protein
MDREHYARLQKRKDDGGAVVIASAAVTSKQGGAGVGGGAVSWIGAAASSVAQYASSKGTSASSTSTKLQKRGKQAFVVPRPGVGGATADSLYGKTFVLTGLFPEVGGGSGLDMGKDKVKAMVQSFGGRVTSGVSGKTDVLVVGRSPGMSKVTKARAQPRCTLLNIDEIVNLVEGGSIEDAAPALIDQFSGGYYGNSLALQASVEELDYAYGNGGPAPLLLKTKAKPKKTKTKKMPAKKRKKAEEENEEVRARPKKKAKKSTKKEEAAARKAAKAGRRAMIIDEFE